jgi:hypothetical protein
MLKKEPGMQDIKQVRFEALAAYCRQPYALIAAEEVRWLQAHDEAILIVVIGDVTDGDYSAMLLARDMASRVIAALSSISGPM